MSLFSFFKKKEFVPTPVKEVMRYGPEVHGFFMNKLIDVIHYVDPDTARFVEWIWADRMKAGLKSFSDSYTIPENAEVDFDEIDALIKQQFNIVYSNPRFLRALDYNKYGTADFYVVAERSGDIIVTCIGEETRVKGLMTYLRETYRKPSAIELETLTGFSNGNPDVSKDELVENLVELGLNSFYPWLDGGVEKLAKEFLESNANVLFMIGERGTAKSTFLRTLMFAMDKLKKTKRYGLVNSEPAIQDPAFGKWLRSMGGHCLIGIEDADNLVRKRQDGNFQMTMLLNHAQGVVQNNAKIVFSTNLETLKDVDEALIRKGRTFKVLEFRRLTTVEANVVRSDLEAKTGRIYLPIPEDFPYTEWTAAEAINYNGESYEEWTGDTSSRKAQSFGFVGQQ